MLRRSLRISDKDPTCGKRKVIRQTVEEPTSKVVRVSLSEGEPWPRRRLKEPAEEDEESRDSCPATQREVIDLEGFDNGGVLVSGILEDEEEQNEPLAAEDATTGGHVLGSHVVAAVAGATVVRFGSGATEVSSLGDERDGKRDSTLSHLSEVLLGNWATGVFQKVKYVNEKIWLGDADGEGLLSQAFGVLSDDDGGKSASIEIRAAVKACVRKKISQMRDAFVRKVRDSVVAIRKLLCWSAAMCARRAGAAYLQPCLCFFASSRRFQGI